MSMNLLDMIKNNGAATGSYQSFIEQAASSNSHPKFGYDTVLPGDVFFLRSGHACLVLSNGLYIHSTDEQNFHGVKMDSLLESRGRKVAFRLNTSPDNKTGRDAAFLVKDWVNDGQNADQGRGKVGYSDVHLPGMGLGLRGIMSAIGPSKFGKGARGRLAKYKGRDGMRPKNAFCSEMCILAYQLVMAEIEAGFINLDAKFTTPPKLLDWFRSNGSWDIVWAGSEYEM